MANYVKFLRGTPEQYSSLTSYDKDTLYFIIDEAIEEKVGSLYLGDTLLAGNLNADGDSVIDTLAELKDVNLAGAVDKNILGYDVESNTWIPMTIEEAMGSSVIKSTQVFETTIDKGADHIEAITTVVGDKELQAGDIAIVKETIAGDKLEYTSYVYNGTAWAAMDGNYSAENVYLSKDISFAGDYTSIGNYKKDGESLKAGTSLQSILSGLLEKELYPTATKPSITLSVSGGNNEVGLSYTLPTATLTTYIGEYTYEPKTATGVAYAIGNVTLAEAANKDSIASALNKTTNTAEMTKGSTLKLQAASSDSLTGIYTDDAQSCTFAAVATYSDGDIPLTNLGNEYPSAQITSDTLDKTATATFTGWRKMFAGTLTDASTELSSSVIRDFSLMNKKVATGTQTFTVPVGAAKIVVALPPARKISKVEYFTMSWEEFAGFTKEEAQVSVADARGGENGLMSYDIWSYTPAGKFEATTQFRITIA